MKKCVHCYESFYGEQVRCPHCNTAFTEEDQLQMRREENAMQARREAARHNEAQQREAKGVENVLELITGGFLGLAVAGMMIAYKYTNDMEFRAYINLSSWTNQDDTAVKLATFGMENRFVFLIIGLFMLAITLVFHFTSKQK